MAAYATISDLYNYRGETMPEDMDEAEVKRLDALLARATTRVTLRLRTARIRLTSARVPVDAHVVTALRDATAAVVDDWEENGVDGESYDSVSMAGVTLSRRAGAAGDGTRARGRLCDDAEAILAAANLWGTRVGH